MYIYYFGTGCNTIHKLCIELYHWVFLVRLSKILLDSLYPNIYFQIKMFRDYIKCNFKGKDILHIHMGIVNIFTIHYYIFLLDTYQYIYHHLLLDIEEKGIQCIYLGTFVFN